MLKQWGLYCGLLLGATFVVNHGAYAESDSLAFFDSLEPVPAPWTFGVGLVNDGAEELEPWRQQVFASRSALFQEHDYFTALADTASLDDYLGVSLFYSLLLPGGFAGLEFSTALGRVDVDDNELLNNDSLLIGVAMVFDVLQRESAVLRTRIGVDKLSVENDAVFVNRDYQADEDYLAPFLAVDWQSNQATSNLFAELRVNRVDASIDPFFQDVGFALVLDNLVVIEAVELNSEERFITLEWRLDKSWYWYESPRDAVELWRFGFSLSGQHAFDKKLPGIYEAQLGNSERLRGYGADEVAADAFAHLSLSALRRVDLFNQALWLGVFIDAAKVELYQQGFSRLYLPLARRGREASRVLPLERVNPELFGSLLPESCVAAAQRYECPDELEEQSDSLWSAGLILQYESRQIYSQLMLGRPMTDYEDIIESGDLALYFNFIWEFQ